MPRAACDPSRPRRTRTPRTRRRQPSTTALLSGSSTTTRPGRSCRAIAAILLYLDVLHDAKDAAAAERHSLGRKFTRFQQALALADRWRAVTGEEAGPKPSGKGKGKKKAILLRPMKRELAAWDAYAAEPEAAASSAASAGCP